MEFDSRIPIYIQIIERIQRDIILGKLAIGDKLPSVRVMASECKVNVNTMQRVYQELEREGIIFSVRGKGSFITESEEMISIIKHKMALDMTRSFVRGMQEIGYTQPQIIEYMKEYMEGNQDGDHES